MTKCVIVVDGECIGCGYRGRVLQIAASDSYDAARVCERCAQKAFDSERRQRDGQATKYEG